MKPLTYLVTRARKATQAGVGAAVAVILAKGWSQATAIEAATAGIVLGFATWRIPNATPVGLP